VTAPDLIPEQRETFAVALCRWWDTVDGAGQQCHTPEDKRPCAACEAEADGLAPVVARMLADAERQGAERALRETADAWQWGEWANAPRRADRVEERLANAQHVTDWLRARAALAQATTPRDERPEAPHG